MYITSVFLVYMCHSQLAIFYCVFTECGEGQHPVVFTDDSFHFQVAPIIVVSLLSLYCMYIGLLSVVIFRAVTHPSTHIQTV